MKILVTGIAGFIGSNFAKQFRVRFPESEIIGLDDLSSGRREEIIDTAIFYKGSVTDPLLVEKIFSTHKPEYVFHFAAIPRVSYSVEHPAETTHVNVTGTVTLLSAAKDHGIKRFVLSSSSSVYGGAKTLPTSESENLPDPKSPYAAQKLCDEIFCKVFSELFGLDTVCLRYFNVFGPGQYGDSAYSTVISAWLEALYFPQNKKAFIEGDGSQSRDFCYVDNVVSANILAMEAPGPLMGEAFNIAHGEKFSVNEVRSMIEEYTGRKLDLEERASRAGDVAHTHADISKANQSLGYEAKTQFKDGLKETVKWFEERIKK